MYDAIAKELLQMMCIDQEMRERAMNDPSAWDREVDRRNTKRLKEIVDEIGWPTISKVGEEASDAAWLLAQHADHDVEFQEKALLLMGEAGNDVLKRHVAYLTDRMLTNRGLPQRFGTQFRKSEGVFAPRPIEDESRLDELRTEFGLESFVEYQSRMIDQYGNK